MLQFLPARAVWQEVDPQMPVARVEVLPPECATDGGMPTAPTTCRVTGFGKGRPTVVVWGDSHAWQQLPAMKAQAERTRTNLVAFVMGACPPARILDGSVDGPCARNSALALKFIADKRKRKQRVKVLIGAFWGFYRDLLDRAANGWEPETQNESFLLERSRLYEAGTANAFGTLARWNVPTAALAQMPWVPDDAPACTDGDAPYACDLPRSTAIHDEAATRAWVSRQLARIPRSGLIDTTDFLCDDDTCSATFQGHPAYLDDLHLDPAITGGFSGRYADFFATPVR